MQRQDQVLRITCTSANSYAIMLVSSVPGRSTGNDIARVTLFSIAWAVWSIHRAADDYKNDPRLIDLNMIKKFILRMIGANE